MIDRSDLTICKDPSEPDIPFRLDVCEIHVVLDNPGDKLISVAFSNVGTTDPAGFFQHTLGGDTAPGCALIPLFPTLVCDSFVTLGEECTVEGSSTDPDFDSTTFNSTGRVNGGWFNSSPANGKGNPDANDRVMTARLSYKQAKNTTGDICVFAKLAGAEDITSFLLQPFDCSVPGMQEGSGGGGAPPGGGTICFVDDNGTPGNSCLENWDSACPDLQTALDKAAVGICDEVWVAEGTYKPSKLTQPLELRSATFQLLNGVSLFGGFPNGGGDGTFGARDPQMFISDLSGDLGTPGNNSDNSFHVVTGSGTDVTAILDGFTITAGHANGGVPMDFAFNQGAGMFNDGGSPTVTNCIFSGNSASHLGGGMANLHSSSPTVTNCIFIGNSLGGSGGGMGNFQVSSPTVTNCTFSGNSAGASGGGMVNHSGSNPTVTNSTFSRNAAGFNGGGMLIVSSASATLNNCIFWENADPGGMDESAQIYDGSGTLVVTFTDIQGLDTFAGNGNIGLDPMFIDADGPDDVVGTEDDNLRLMPGSPCIDRANNFTVPPGIVTDLDRNPRFVNDPATDDLGNGEPPVVDMGAYEFQACQDCPWDFDADGAVGPFDLATLLGAWGPCNESCQLAQGCPCQPDFNGDCAVGPFDLASLLAAWGTCP